MTILQPLALLGLLALPVIVILHLLRERSRRHDVPSLELWTWLQSEVRGPKPRRLPWNWILFLQLVAALLLTLALIRPQFRLPLAPSQAERIILVVDTSTSMSAQDVRPSRLAEAQARAGALLASLGGDDSVALISAGPVARRVSDSSLSGLPSLASALASLQPAGVGNDWSAALALASASTVHGLANRVIVYSDGAYDLPASVSAAAGNVPAEVEWVLIGNPQPNQAVVTLAARPSASGAVQVFTRLANFGDVPVQRVVSLLADGETIDSSQTVLDASGTVALSWTLPPGVGTVEVRLAGADVLPADDRAALGVFGGGTVDALLVGENTTAIERALNALPNLRLSTVAPSSYVPFEPHDLTVFQGWLPAVWPEGGVLVIDPPANSSLLPVADTVSASEFAVAPIDPLFADVSLDQVSFTRAALLQAPPWLVPVLTEVSGAGLVWRGAIGASRVVVMSFSLDDTNLTRRAAFPVLIANAVAELAPPALPESILPGEPVALPSSRAFPSLTVTTPDGQSRNFGADRPGIYEETGQSGLYVLEGMTPDGEAWRTGFGVNPGAPSESDLRRQTQPEGEGALAGVIDLLTRPNPLSDLWPYLAGLVLVLMLVEARVAWR